VPLLTRRANREKNLWRDCTENGGLIYRSHCHAVTAARQSMNEEDEKLLRSILTLTAMNQKPAAELWKTR
jgi:hypothetical protein